MNTPSLRKFRATVFTAVLAVVSLAPAVQAQDHKMTGTVNVPFAFATGNHHFAPGLYTISMETPNFALITGASTSVFVLTQSGGDLQPAKKSKVVFRRRGDQYFLAEIWIAQKIGYQDVVKSKAERRLLVAGQKSAPTGVELALLDIVR
jgi:hypothetical protein